MKTVKAKQLLRDIRSSRIELKALEEKREILENKAVKITRNISGTQGTSGRKKDLSDSVVGLLELDETLKKRIDAVARQERTVLEMIKEMDTPMYRTLLILYYIAGDQPAGWDSVAEQMHYSRSAVCHFHGRALQELQRVIDKRAHNCTEQ